MASIEIKPMDPKSLSKINPRNLFLSAFFLSLLSIVLSLYLFSSMGSIGIHGDSFLAIGTCWNPLILGLGMLFISIVGLSTSKK